MWGSGRGREPFSDVTGRMEKTSICRDEFTDLVDVFYSTDNVLVKLKWTAR